MVAVFFNITYYMRKREYMAREKMKGKPNQVNCMNRALWMHETCFHIKYIRHHIISQNLPVRINNDDDDI